MSLPLASGSTLYAAATVCCIGCKAIGPLDSAILWLDVPEGT